MIFSNTPSPDSRNFSITDVKIPGYFLCVFLLLFGTTAWGQEKDSLKLSVRSNSSLGVYHYFGEAGQPFQFIWDVSTASFSTDSNFAGRLVVQASADTVRSKDDVVVLDSVCKLPTFNYSEHPLRHQLRGGEYYLLTSFYPTDTTKYNPVTKTVVTKVRLYTNIMKLTSAAITSFRESAYSNQNKIHLEVEIQNDAGSARLGSLSHNWEVGVGKSAGHMDKVLSTFYRQDSLVSNTSRFFMRTQFFDEVPTQYKFIVVKMTGYFTEGYRKLQDQTFSVPLHVITDPDAMVALEQREYPFLTYGKCTFTEQQIKKLNFDTLRSQANTLYRLVGNSLSATTQGDYDKAFTFADSAFAHAGRHRESATIYAPPGLVFELYSGIVKMLEKKKGPLTSKAHEPYTVREEHASKMRSLMEKGYTQLLGLTLPDTLADINDMELSGFYEKKDRFRQTNVIDLPVLWRARTVPAFEHFLRVGDLETADVLANHVDQHIAMVAPLWKILAADTSMRSSFHWLGNTVSDENEMLSFLLARLRIQQELGFYTEARKTLAMAEMAFACSDQSAGTAFWSGAASFYESLGAFQKADSLYKLIDQHWALWAAKSSKSAYTAARGRLNGRNAELLQAKQKSLAPDAPRDEQWGKDLDVFRAQNPIEYFRLLADPNLARKLGFFNSPIFISFYFNQIKQLQVQNAEFLANAWLKDFAFLLGRQQKYDEALKLYERLFFMHNLQSIAFRLGFPEETQLFRSRMQQDVYSRFLNVLAGYEPSAKPGRYDSLVNLALEQAMFQHEFILHGNRQLLYDINRSTDPAVQQKAVLWQEWRKYLNKLYLQDKPAPADIAIVRREILRLEGELARLSRDTSSMKYDYVIPVDSIRNFLKEDEVAIEMVRYTVNHEAYYRQDARYAAMIIRKSGPVKMVWFPTEGKLMEGRYFKYYRNSIQQRTADAYAYKIYWEPMEPYLKGVKKVYWSPDGVYHLLNPNTFFNPATRQYVLDELMVQTLPTIASLRKQVPVKIVTATVVGNPLFGAQAGKASDTVRTSREWLTHQPIVPLPGTRKEADAITTLLQQGKVKVTTLTEGQATKGEIFKNGTSQLLHLATHGFWIDRAAGSESGFFDLYETLSGSGIILAGAQQKEGTGFKLNAEGILTAAEMQDMELWNTELVVLSACETGLGEVIPGQGLYGLKRALQKAGARHVITSLWKVDDAATSEFMTQFYRQLSKTGNMTTSFQSAMTGLRIKFPDPYYWGAFVLTNN